jgi:hypothetical protein
MDVQQDRGARSQRSDQIRPEKQLADVVTVENVEVETIGHLSELVDRLPERQQVS